jgi:hypothetical protein
MRFRAIRVLSGRWLTFTAPIRPSMLAVPASTLYTTEKNARSRSAPSRRKESARSVCVQSVREGSTMARNLRFRLEIGKLQIEGTRHTSSGFARSSTPFPLSNSMLSRSSVPTSMLQSESAMRCVVSCKRQLNSRVSQESQATREARASFNIYQSTVHTRE